MDEIISLNIAEQKYRVLIDNAPEPVFIFDAETFKFVDFNNNALELFKVPADQLIGMGPDSFTPDMIYGKQSGPLIVQYVSEALQGGNPVFDWIHLDSEGQELACEIRLVRFPPYDKKLVRASVTDNSEQKKLEAALKEREERLDLALNATNLGTFDMDLVNGKLIWDKRMHEIFGLPIDSTQDRKEYFFSVIHPEDRESVMEEFVTLMGFNSEKTTFKDEYRICKDGEVRHIVTNGFLLRNDAGEVLRAIGTCFDNSESKRIQDKLKESEDRFSKSFHNNITPMLIFNLETGERIEANKSFLDLIGYTEEEYKRGNLHNSALWRYPEQKLRGNELFKKDGFVHNFAVDLITKSGDIRQVLMNSVKLDSVDSIGITSIVDVTEFNRGKEALQKSEEQYRNLVENSHDLIWELDAQGNFTFLNSLAEDFYGYKPEELIGLNFSQMIAPEALEETMLLFQRILESGNEVNRNESQIVHKNGDRRLVDSNYSVRRDKIGNVIGIIGASENITEKKKAEEALKESEAHFRALFEQSQVSFFIHDLEGRFVDVNQKMADVYGYTKDEMLELSIFDLFPDDKEQQAKSMEAIQKLMETGATSFESYSKQKSGEYFPGQVTSTLIKVGDQHLVYGVGIDLTERKQAEMILRESEERFNKIFTYNPQVMTLIDFETRTVIDVNNAFIKKYGYKKEEIINKPGIVGFTLNKDKKSEEAFKILAETNRLSEYELTAYTKEGKEIVGLYYFEPIELQGKNVHIVSRVDITERKRAEKALKESEKRFYSVFQQQFQFMAILSPEGRVMEINELLLRVTKATREDFVGKYFWETPAWENLHQEKEKIKKEVLQAAKVQVPVFAQDAYQTVNGEIRYTDSAYSAIRDADKNLLYILVQATDITERKKAEEKLDKARLELSEITERFQISTKAAKVGIWDCYINEGKVIWDDTMYELYGLDKTHKIENYSDWNLMFHPDDIERVKRELEIAQTGEAEFNTEYRIIWPDQSVHYIKAVATAQRDAKGNAYRMTGTNWDITKEKEAEQQKIHAGKLELKNKELEQFAYIASHDLKEPIRTVKSFAEILKRRYEDKLDSNANEYLGFISQGASRMDKLIKALLEYSQIGRNRILTTINCNTLLQNLKEDLSVQISESNVEIQSCSLPELEGYEVELRVLFQNLISNAIKFRKKEVDPQITINVKKKNKQWEFCVTDNGIGIKPEYKERIFAIYQRLHTQIQYEGTGIGLAHCQKIVDLHGGRIWVESEEGKGSSFYFTIQDFSAQ